MPPLYSQRYAYIFIMQAKYRTMQGKRKWQILILSCMIYKIDEFPWRMSFQWSEMCDIDQTSGWYGFLPSPLIWYFLPFWRGSASICHMDHIVDKPWWSGGSIWFVLWFYNYLEENRRVKADNRKYTIETHEHCLNMLDLGFDVGFDTLTKQVSDRASSGFPW